MQRPPLLASICALIGLVILLLLGTWQLQKYLMRSNASDLCVQSDGKEFDGAFVSLHQQIADGCSVTLEGVLQASPIIPIVQWNKDGGGDDGTEISYHIYAYLKAQDGSRILTNLGLWDNPAPQIMRDKVKITGALYKPAGPNAYSPANTPVENRWYVLNLPQIQAHFNVGGNVSEHVLIARNIVDKQGKDITRFMPASLHKSYLQPETHLQYTLFWYAMACALFFIFVLRFCRKP